MACESATLSLLGGLRSLPGDLRSFAILILALALPPAVNADLASSAFLALALPPAVTADLASSAFLAHALLPAVNADLASSAFPAEALLPVVNAAAPGALAPLKIVPTNNGVDLRDCQEL